MDSEWPTCTPHALGQDSGVLYTITSTYSVHSFDTEMLIINVQAVSRDPSVPIRKKSSNCTLTGRFELSPTHALLAHATPGTPPCGPPPCSIPKGMHGQRSNDYGKQLMSKPPRPPASRGLVSGCEFRLQAASRRFHELSGSHYLRRFQELGQKKWHICFLEVSQRSTVTALSMHVSN